MNSKEMDQIRELLIGDFVQDTRNQFETLNAKLDDIEEDYKQSLDRLVQSFNAKIVRIDKISTDRYKYLENQIDEKLKEQSRRTDTLLEGIKTELSNQNENTNRSLSMLKKVYDSKLQSLRDEHSAKSVSKTSLASMFLEYSLKLKDSDIESKIKSEIPEDITR